LEDVDARSPKAPATANAASVFIPCKIHASGGFPRSSSSRMAEIDQTVKRRDG
jgi:hypothetical protein